MEDEPNERVRKSSRKSRTTQFRRKTSRIYDLVVSAFSAVKYGDFENLVLITNSLQTKEECNLFTNAKDKEGNTLILKCIHSAASRQSERHGNFMECLNFLLSAGVDVNAQDNLSRTALHWIVLYGRLDFLDLLQAAGGNLLILDSSGLNPLHLAIGIKSERLRDKFIEYICSCAPQELLEAADGNGRNPLFLALTVKAVKTFEKLLTAKVNPDSCGPDGRKLIIHSVEKGHGRFTELLLRHGASLTTRDPEGFSVVHLAACQENPDSIFVFTEMLNKTLLSVKDHLGRTPLMYACLMGFDKNVELLLSQKIWILDQDNEGKTALHHTISNTHTGCVELLCRENSKIMYICDSEGHLPAHDTVIAGNLLILNCLLQYGCDVKSKDYSGCTLLHWATAYGTLSCFQKLLESNSPLEEIDNHGATPLHYGCQKDDDEKLASARTEILKVLLSRGVKLTVADAEGRRPIHWSSTSGNMTALKVLIDHGDDVNAVTSQEKMTPLHICAVQGHEDIVKYLVNQDGIHINVQDQQKCTPLFYACSARHSQVAEILLQSGADPNLSNDVGESPSHTAAMNGSVECLRLLFKFGANLSSLNDQKDTPLHDAASVGKEDVVRFLVEKGCQLTVRNITRATPLHYSVAERCTKITEILLDNGAFVNALVTTNETDFVTPLDIALGNSDHDQIQLLQKFGAMTGHCVVNNSALIIQHHWRVFKRRVADSICGSNAYEWVDSYEGTDLKLMKNDTREELNSVIEKEMSSADIEENKEYHDDKVKEENCIKSVSIVKDETLNDSLDRITDEKEGGSLIEQSTDRAKISQLKISTATRISSSKLECNRTDDLFKRAENLKKKLENVLQETHNIANSREFQMLLNPNKSKALKNKSAVFNLPRIASI